MGAVAAIGLALTQGLLAWALPTESSAVVFAALSAAGTWAGLRLLSRACFDARVVLIVIAALTMCGILLETTVGFPGADHPIPAAVIAVEALLAVMVMGLLITIDHARVVVRDDQVEPAYHS